MAITLLTSAVIVGAAAGAIALAPSATATTNDMECADRGSATLCQKSGHASMNVSPGTEAGGADYWPFAAGPATPPIWATS